MNPAFAANVARIVIGAAAGGAVAVPTIVNGQPTALPVTIEEAIAQVILALVSAGVIYLRKRLKVVK